jgi:hypothetical protein
MKSLLKILIVIVIITSQINLNAQSTYIQEFGNNSEHDVALSLCEKSNGEILTLGYQRGIGAFTFDLFYLTNFDKDGAKIKSNEIGYLVNHKGKMIRKTTDGGYILGGDGKWCTGTACGNDGMLVKLDAALNIVWSSALGGLFPIDDIADVRETAGGFYVLANVGSPTTGLDLCLAKLNTLGDTVWTKTFSGYANNANSEDRAYAINANSDGSVMVLSRAYNASNASYTNVSIMKVNANGNIAWNKIANGFSAIVDELIEVNDGYMFINAWGRLVKVDLNGNFVWQKGVSPTSITPSFYKINKDNVGNILMCGTENNKALIMKIKQDGTILFAKKYNTTNDSHLDDVVQLSDGRIAASGFTTKNSLSKSLLICANSSGVVGNSCQSDLNISLQDVTPNPTFTNYNYVQIVNPVYMKIPATNVDITNGNHTFTQSCKNLYSNLGVVSNVLQDISVQVESNFISINSIDVSEVKLINLYGQLIYNANENKIINTNNFATGVYLLYVKNKKNETCTKKIFID